MTARQERGRSTRIGRIMRRTMRVATALAIAAGALTAGATAAQASGTYEGCPYGFVCVYPQDAGWNGGRPSLLYAG
jgi:ABC-type sugar transport system substrate-binding protein